MDEAALGWSWSRGWVGGCGNGGGLGLDLGSGAGNGADRWRIGGGYTVIGIWGSIGSCGRGLVCLEEAAPASGEGRSTWNGGWFGHKGGSEVVG